MTNVDVKVLQQITNGAAKTQDNVLMDSGCGSVGRMVAS